jgi:hypothetical protein
MGHRDEHLSTFSSVPDAIWEAHRRVADALNGALAEPLGRVGCCGSGRTEGGQLSFQGPRNSKNPPANSKNSPAPTPARHIRARGPGSIPARPPR